MNVPERRLIRHAILAETDCFTRLLRPACSSKSQKVSLLRSQIHSSLSDQNGSRLVWLPAIPGAAVLAVDNDFAAVFKGNGQYTAVISQSISLSPSQSSRRSSMVARVDQPGDEIHCRSLLYPVLSDGGSIAAWGQGFKVCTSAVRYGMIQPSPE